MGFLTGKTAIITGAGRAVLEDGSCGSIGYGIATAYAKEGANLVITGRNVKKLEAAKEELERLLAICKMHDVYIISDEIHHDLVFEDNKHISSLSFKEYEDRMVMLTAASKTFNLAGAQNSIVVIPDEKLREKWDKYTLGHRVIGGNAFGYIATQAAYEGGEEWLTGIKAQIYDNYLYLKKELSEKLPEVIVTPLEGTYLCWVDLKAYVSEENIKDMIQKKCRLAVDYGDWFGGERFGTHIRINLATSHENVKIAVDALVDNI